MEWRGRTWMTMVCSRWLGTCGLVLSSTACSSAASSAARYWKFPSAFSTARPTNSCGSRRFWLSPAADHRSTNGARNGSDHCAPAPSAGRCEAGAAVGRSDPGAIGGFPGSAARPGRTASWRAARQQGRLEHPPARARSEWIGQLSAVGAAPRLSQRLGLCHVAERWEKDRLRARRGESLRNGSGRTHS